MTTILYKDIVTGADNKSRILFPDFAAMLFRLVLRPDANPPALADTVTEAEAAICGLCNVLISHNVGPLKNMWVAWLVWKRLQETGLETREAWHVRLLEQGYISLLNDNVTYNLETGCAISNILGEPTVVTSIGLRGVLQKIEARSRIREDEELDAKVKAARRERELNA